MSQVCSIVWSKNEEELVSSHGFSHNQLTLWKYPSMVKLAELTGSASALLLPRLAGSALLSTNVIAHGSWRSRVSPLLSSPRLKTNHLRLKLHRSAHRHTSRVLHLAQSPDGETVVSGAADETLRFWKVFGPAKRKSKGSGLGLAGGTLGGVIR